MTRQPTVQPAGLGDRGASVDELLTPDEVAERLRTSPRFVRRLVAERRIAFTKVGKFVRIASTDVEAFLAAGRVEPGTSYVRPTLRVGTALSGRERR